MSSNLLDIVKRYGRLLGKGFIADKAPEIAKGLIVEMLKAKGVNVKKATEWVQGNACLWDTLEPKYQNIIIRLRRNAGRLDWLTADWIIDAMKRDIPSVASLFIGWRKGKNWLARQAEIIKERTEKWL